MSSRTATALGTLALLAASALPALAVDPAPAASAPRTDTETIIVGSADFPESQLLATIYAKALAAKGVRVTTRLNIGSREVYMPALLDGSIDLLPEYSGAELSYLDKTATARSPRDVAVALKAALPKGVSMLEPSPAADSDVLAVTRATAEKDKLKTIADLKPFASGMVLGGPPEWKTRQEGVVGLKAVYGLDFKAFKSLDAGGPLTLSALQNGQVQAADMFSTDPAMASSDLVALDDVDHVFAAQNVVPIMSTAKASGVVTKVLDAVSAALTTQDLIAMNARLANQDSYDDVAQDWLAKHPVK